MSPNAPSKNSGHTNSLSFFMSSLLLLDSFQLLILHRFTNTYCHQNQNWILLIFNNMLCLSQLHSQFLGNPQHKSESLNAYFCTNQSSSIVTGFLMQTSISYFINFLQRSMGFQNSVHVPFTDEPWKCGWYHICVLLGHEDIQSHMTLQQITRFENFTVCTI